MTWYPHKGLALKGRSFASSYEYPLVVYPAKTADYLSRAVTTLLRQKTRERTRFSKVNVLHKTKRITTNMHSTFRGGP